MSTLFLPNEYHPARVSSANEFRQRTAIRAINAIQPSTARKYNIPNENQFPIKSQFSSAGI